MVQTAEVVINLPVREIAKPFTYIIPDGLGGVDVGWRVLVPFGNRQVEGFVMSTQAGLADGLKPIIRRVDDEPWFSEHMLTVAKWLSDYYLCTMAEGMRLFIPGKAGMKAATYYAAIQQSTDILAGCGQQLKEVYGQLEQSGPCTAKQLQERFGAGVGKVLKQLVEQGLITAQAVARRTANPQYTTYWQLAIGRHLAQEKLEQLTSKPAQKRLLALLLHQEKVTTEELTHMKISKATVKGLEQAGVIASGQIQRQRDSFAGMGLKVQDFKLSQEQQLAWDQINPALEARQTKTFLLYGITGSGKTQIYIEEVAAVRKMGRQAIVLVPEIALIPQITARFKERFGTDVVVLHSRLSVGERYDTWQRLRAGLAGIVIGARSAVFAPVPDLGLIVIDEEHEFTYKQEETPHYHTTQVARKRAELTGAVVILGSATPSLESFYAAANGIFSAIHLPSRIDGAVLPEVEIVDMRAELQAGRRSVISLALRELLTSCISRGEQAIILLNRRGYATFVICRECGHVMRCPNCEVSLVYHINGGGLQCHYCQARQATPDTCPACSSRYIRFFGTGTQKVEEELASILPEARIIRMDQDTTRGKTGHEKILTEFSAGRFDILLGTQMVAKGHDIKNVTAVGIISADTALNLPDFRAAERTFSLLTQAAGRAGRGLQPGKVVVQTYNPDHYAIVAGANHDYPAFYEQEIRSRQELYYPPISQMIKITLFAREDKLARRRSEEVAAELMNAFQGSGTLVIGPFPAAVAKIDNIYRMQILIKTTDMGAASQLIRDKGFALRADLAIDVDPLQVL